MLTGKMRYPYKANKGRNNDNVNVLLVNLPYLSFSLLDRFFMSPEAPEMPLLLDIPLGLLYLASYAREYSKRDFNIKLLDINKEIFQIFKKKKESEISQTGEGIYEQLNSIISQAISEFRPSIVGINILFATTQQSGVIVSEIFRRLCPEAYIIAGGVQATNTYRNILTKGRFDAVIRGEGEIPFTELINRYAPGRKEYPIAGIVSRENIEQDNTNTKAAMPMELDKIPFPDYDLLSDIDSYVTQLGAVRVPLDGSLRAWPIFTTRGCPMKCSFCASHSAHGRKIRVRSLRNIYDEIETLISRFQINTLLIVDDLFTYDRQRTIDFCQEAIKRKWQLKIEFTSGLAIWTLDKVVIDMLVKAGTKVINIAIESGSPYVQKNIIRKNLNLAHAREVAEIIFRYHLEVESRVFYVIGFPGEQWEHICQTREFAKSLPQDWSVFQLAMPLPGSELFEECVSLGYIQRDTNFDDFCKSTLNRMFDTKEFTKDELEAIQSDLNIEINFLANRNMLDGNYKKALSIFRKIVEIYPFHIIARYCIYKCLRELNLNEESQKELEAIFYWIKQDRKARRLYDRYRSFLKIPKELEKRLEEDTICPKQLS